MRSLQGRDAPRRKRDDDVSLRVAHSDKDPENRDEILLHGLEARLRRENTPAAMEILEKLGRRTLPVVEAALDAVVAEASASDEFLTARGPRCLLHVTREGRILPVEILITTSGNSKNDAL